MSGLSRDPTCLKDLTWRVDLPVERIAEAEAAMEHAGFEVRSRSFVVVFDTPDGHRIIVVPRTGRVQLRLSYLVPKTDRVGVAHALHQRLEGIWSERQVVFAGD